MKISLSEHCSFKIFKSTENPIKSRFYLDEDIFSRIKKDNRRKVFSKIFPFQLQYNEIEDSLDLLADYYIGLDWLVEGERFVQVEPKVNKKLLEIYRKTIDKDLESQDDVISEDKANKKEVKESQFENENFKKVDYLKMLLEVYASEIPKEKIGDLAEIYWDEAKIKIEQKDDYLTPFLVVQFLGLLKVIVRKGLKKSYYKVQKNLQNRVKGKVLVGQQIKQNVFKNRFTSTYCEYQVFGENSLENQFLKKVSHFCNHYIQNNPHFFKSTKTELNHTINYIRPAFELIDDTLKENQLQNFKHNPFFKEYKEAIKIGNFILKQLGYNISVNSGKEIETPPFWIDMPRLFELYFYRQLLKDNPSESKKIKFQFATYGNALDFLIIDGVNSIVIDTKYKLHYEYGQIHQDIRQVSGYARLKKVRKECGLDKNDDTHINCLIVYPILEKGLGNFSISKIQSQLIVSNEIKAYHKVYKLGFELPVI